MLSLGRRRTAALWLSGWIALWGVPARVEAVDMFWSNFRGDGSGTFSVAVNWTESAPFSSPPPDANDIAHFGMTTSDLIPKTYTVTFTNSPTNRQAIVEDDRVTFDLNSHVYTLANTSTAVVLGTESGRSGQLTVTDGAVSLPFEADLEIGSTSGGSGVLTVGAAGVVIGSPDLIVGVNGSGVLNIVNNGDVVADDTILGLNAGSTGTATITGSGSVLQGDSLAVGSNGSGALNVTAGGRVDINGATVGGFDSVSGTGTGTGTVNVDGSGSEWINSGILQVGAGFGQGTLNITAGGFVRNTGAVVGFFGDGDVTVDGPTSQWINSGNLTLGDEGGDGTLDILAGGRVESIAGRVGYEGTTSTGTVNVDGALGDSQWINSGQLNVGFQGTGTLNITAGGRVESNRGIVGGDEFGSAGTGTVNVNGALGDSQWINSGVLQMGAGGGQGILNITAGGFVRNTGGVVGFGTDGDVTVDGSTSQWINSGKLTIGTDDGEGTLNIRAGGRVESSSGSVGDDRDSTGTVNVDGTLGDSQWINSGQLNVGFEGTGTLNITAGGRVDSNGVTVGGNDNSSAGTGTVNVDGTGSQWINSGSAIVGFNGAGDVTVRGPTSQWINSGSLTIGFDVGDGTLNILAGGRVESSSGRVGTGDTAGTATVTVAGAASTWTISSGLLFGEDSISNGGAGTVRIQTGGTVSVAQETILFANDELRLEGGTFSSTDISFQGGGTFAWTSGTLHVGVFDGSLTVPNGGVLAPGNSAGTTRIEGSFAQQVGGTLHSEIGGIAEGTQYDIVNVLGNAALGGNLQLSTLNDFIPSAASTFIILQATGSITGAFANVANGQRVTISNGLGSFLVHYGPGSAFNTKLVVLSAFQAVLPGDYNQNGTVDAADYTVWRDHLGQSFTLTNENPAAATPGVVDAEDYAVWKSHFGESLGSGSGSTANATVPEPATLVLLTLATIGWSLRRRRAA